MGRLALALGGMVIGGLVGGPFGARIGFAIGAYVGGRLFGDEQVTEGPRIEDRSISTATYGSPIPIAYGVNRITAFYLWVENNELIEVQREESVGKGGGGSYRYYEYYISCAVGFCEGVQDALLILYADTKIIYRNSEKIEVSELDDYFNGEVTQIEGLNLTIYKGDETQLPDPLIEAEHGVGNVPAHRGMAYIVLERLPLKDLGNRPPNFSAVWAQNSSYQILRLEQQAGSANVGATGFDIDSDQKYLWASNGGLRITKWSLGSRSIIAEVDFSTGTTVFGTRIDNAAFASLSLPTYGTGTLDGWGGQLVYSDAADTLVLSSGFTFLNVLVDPNSLAPTGGFNKGVTYSNYRLSGRGAGRHLFHQAPGNQGTDIYITQIGQTGDSSFISSGVGANFQVLSGGAGTYDIAFPSSWSELGGYQEAGQPLIMLWGGTGGAAIRLAYTEPADDPSLNAYQIYTGSDRKIFYSAMTNPPQAGSINLIERNGRYYVYGGSGLSEIDPDTGEEIAFISKSFVDSNGKRTADRSADGDRYLWFASGIGQSSFFKVDLECMEIVETEPYSNWDAARIGSEVPGQIVYLDNYDGFLTFSSAGTANGYNRPVIWTRGGGSISKITLASIISDLSSRTILDGSQYDVSDLDQTLWGYQVSRPTQVRRPIEELMSVYQFSAHERDGVVYFWNNGREVTRAIDPNDIGMADVGEIKPRVEENRVQEVELPYKFEYTFLNIADSFQESTQGAHRANEATASREHVDLRLPIVHQNTEAARIAANLLYTAWVERRMLKFSLPRKYNDLHPQSHISLPFDDITYSNIRIEKMVEGAENMTMLEFEGVVTEPDTFGANTVDVTGVGGLAPYRPQVRNVLPSELFLMDTPLLRDEDEIFAGGFYYAAARNTGEPGIWNGAEIYKSSDNQTYAPWNAITNEIPFGYVNSTLGSSKWQGRLFDHDDFMDVTMISGGTSLASATMLSVLNGANACMVEVLNGDWPASWEVIQYETVEQIGESRYRLTGLLRGRRGTEHLHDQHAAGERIIFPSATTVRRSNTTSDKGLLRYYKPVSIGNLFSAEDAEQFTLAGRGERPLNPVHFAFARDGSGNYTITFVRRTRIGGETDWLDGVLEVPLSETTEEYEVDVLDQSGNVLRTLTSTTESVSYTNTQQIADFGALPSRIEINGYMNNDTFGRSVPTYAISDV